MIRPSSPSLPRLREIFGFDRAAKIVRVDSDPVVVAPAQRCMRVQRDGRVDDGAAVIVDEVMRQVGAAAAEADAHRRAGAGEDFALLAEVEQVAAEDVHQPPVGVEDRHDVDALVEQLEICSRGAPARAETKSRLMQLATSRWIDIPDSSRRRMSPSVTAPTTARRRHAQTGSRACWH